MTTPLRQLLAQYRATAKTEREKGNYFERLAVAFLKNDPGMAQEYENAWLKTDAASGTVNDANRFTLESMGDPACPLKLLQRVITVSLETMKIVRAMPRLEI